MARKVVHTVSQWRIRPPTVAMLSWSAQRLRTNTRSLSESYGLFKTRALFYGGPRNRLKIPAAAPDRIKPYEEALASTRTRPLRMAFSRAAWSSSVWSA